jgi:hypothetical protein
MNKLDPSINKSPWTIEEDKLIIQMFREDGPRWSIIAK